MIFSVGIEPPCKPASFCSLSTIEWEGGLAHLARRANQLIDFLRIASILRPLVGEMACAQKPISQDHSAGLRPAVRLR
jgi:hypothetical protein